MARGGDSTPFPSVIDPQTGRQSLVGYPCHKAVSWTLNYDPNGNDRKGVITATIGNDTAICQLDEGHKADGATFDRFGIMNVMKSADGGSEIWLDDLAICGSAVETFEKDPQWEGRNNRQTFETKLVRPWFDFGFSNTQFSGGKSIGELGGQIFRGDCRDAARMACYGDRVDNLTLARPIKASGKIAMTRGVTDSTTLFGFYNSKDSMRTNESQNDGVPESVMGIHIEGPSRDGFKFYPTIRTKGRKSAFGRLSDFSAIYPDRQSHDWSLIYDPAGAEGRGQIVVTFDGKVGTFDLRDGDQIAGTTFDRFGIVTSWIDGNGQHLYFDDMTYTTAQK